MYDYDVSHPGIQHELAVFLRQDASEMQSEYNRIRTRTVEDPGTAGDEGEEAWAEVLRDWLPERYEVVTKGRLLSSDGRAGPQLDIIVLRPGYPRRLLNKKLYLVGGVIAAFECKNTLTAEHVRRCFAQARAIDELITFRKETPFGQIVPQIYFGLLAHSTVWHSEDEAVRRRIDALLQEGLARATSCRYSPSLLCVSDLQCWSTMRMAYDGPGLMPEEIWQIRRERAGLPAEGCHSVQYNRYAQVENWPEAQPPFNPLSHAIAAIFARIAHEDASTRLLSQYFYAAGLEGSGVPVAARTFPLSDYPETVRRWLPTRLSDGERGSEWQIIFDF